uniref:FUSE-binding protein-interacting repressor n=1 Tax=Euglena gracilis TaxID=3039 RepID=A0AA51UAN0_EUGGR|nr:FUSE-binding protein-interacting repressor [Euglena gracilis]BDX17132.1 60 kDa poly(U)-binding-splicing factor A [Euglena gracilis]
MPGGNDSDGSSDHDKKKKKERRRRSRSPSDGESRRRKRSRSKSPKKPKERRSAWDDPTGQATPFSGNSILAPVLTNVTAAPSSHVSPSSTGTAAFLTSAAQMALARVYVGNIYFEIGEDDIRAIFERCGSIRSVQLTKEPGQSKHRGFCFIEFDSVDSAETAITTMNGYQLAGRTLRVGRPHNPAASITPNIQASVPALQPILLPQKDEVAVQHGLPQVRACKMCIPGEPRPPAGYPLKGEPKIYVANIPLAATEETLMELFTTTGHIRAIKTEVYPDDKTKKFSLIEFADDAAAERAVSAFHGHRMDGHKFKVGRVLPLAAAQNTLIFQQVQQVTQMRQAGLPIPSNYGLSQMTLGNIPAVPVVESITHEESMNISTGSARVALMQKLMRKEEVDTLKIPKPHGVVLGPKDAPHALSTRAPTPAPTGPGEVNTPTRCVVLTNLVGSPAEVDDELMLEVKEECSKYGHVEHLLILDEENPTTRKVESKFFVLYSNLPSAMKAMEKFNGRFFAKRRISCRFYHEALFRKLSAD